jgi:hypothetical protein
MRSLVINVWTQLLHERWSPRRDGVKLRLCDESDCVQGLSACRGVKCLQGLSACRGYVRAGVKCSWVHQGDWHLCARRWFVRRSVRLVVHALEEQLQGEGAGDMTCGAKINASARERTSLPSDHLSNRDCNATASRAKHSENCASESTEVWGLNSKAGGW